MEACWLELHHQTFRVEHLRIPSLPYAVISFWPGLHYSLQPLFTVLGDWFPAFVFSPFSYAEEGYDSGDLLLGLAALLDDDDVDC
jgi:hypothetical protein